ncbi:hypothetical protein ACJX0J_032512, partial [Zea mays]
MVMSLFTCAVAFNYPIVYTSLVATNGVVTDQSLQNLSWFLYELSQSRSKNMYMPSLLIEFTRYRVQIFGLWYSGMSTIIV